MTLYWNIWSYLQLTPVSWLLLVWLVKWLTLGQGIRRGRRRSSLRWSFRRRTSLHLPASHLQSLVWGVGHLADPSPLKICPYRLTGSFSFIILLRDTSTLVMQWIIVAIVDWYEHFWESLFSTVEDVLYCDGIPSVLWRDNTSTVEEIILKVPMLSVKSTELPPLYWWDPPK